jgi:hypothetical protein
MRLFGLDINFVVCLGVIGFGNKIGTLFLFCLGVVGNNLKLRLCDYWSPYLTFLSNIDSGSVKKKLID